MRTDVRLKATMLVAVTIWLFLVTALPHVEGTLYINWTLNTTSNGEFTTAFAHLYGVPKWEKTYGLYFCNVTFDASEAALPAEGIIEISVGDYAQPARLVYEITRNEVYSYGLNPTFNAKVAEVSTPTPVTVDLKVTKKTGEQLFAESKTILMLPIGYYAWVSSDGSDMRRFIPVLATPHADPIEKVISAAARATPWNAIVAYQDVKGYSHYDVVDYQMRAVYNVLQNLGVTYVSTTTTFTSTEAQRVRLPVQTLSDNSGNCIETTLLFDAIFEAIGFRTALVFVTEHVYLAVSQWSDSDQAWIPLETTMLGSGTYDAARDTGLAENRKAKDDQMLLVVDVQEMRMADVAPTPYMDSMPGGTRFYQKIDQISSEIETARNMIDKLRGAMNEGTSVSAEKQFRDAVALFNNGMYADAEKLVADATASLTITTATTTSDTGSSALGFIFLLMPVALIVMMVLYVRARRRRTVTVRAAAATTPITYLQPRPLEAGRKHCVHCGADVPVAVQFCTKCGRRQ